ncbi:MAG: primosomal protein N', partial [Deltaproteobacteria bacterium]|nr:primosomal protein N' [Deltaproteobacteria bacterium]
CGKTGISYLGQGTEKLEAEIAFRFPGVAAQRMDSDTMRKPQDYRAALERFERGDADILIGTQMVAKGLDFPRVGLVGVLDADAMLTQADFRAPERTFQLLMQTIGRAGRRAGASEALVQCLDPQQPVLRAAVRMDYEAFAAYELELRRELGDPPYARLTRLVFSDPSAAKARRAAAELFETLKALAGRIHAGLKIDPPTPCLIPQLRGLSRHELRIHAPKPGLTQQLLALARSEMRLPRAVERFRVDIDCVDLS